MLNLKLRQKYKYQKSLKHIYVYMRINVIWMPTCTEAYNSINTVNFEASKNKRCRLWKNLNWNLLTTWVAIVTIKTFITVISLESLSAVAASISFITINAVTSGGGPGWFTGGAIQKEPGFFLAFIIIYNGKFYTVQYVSQWQLILAAYVTRQ